MMWTVIIDYLEGFVPRGSGGSPRFSRCRHPNRLQIYCLLERNYTRQKNVWPTMNDGKSEKRILITGVSAVLMQTQNSCLSCYFSVFSPPFKVKYFNVKGKAHVHHKRQSPFRQMSVSLMLIFSFKDDCWNIWKASLSCWSKRSGQCLHLLDNPRTTSEQINNVNNWVWIKLDMFTSHSSSASSHSSLPSSVFTHPSSAMWLRAKGKLSTGL